MARSALPRRLGTWVERASGTGRKKFLKEEFVRRTQARDAQEVQSGELRTTLRETAASP
jgi:hypothetical protein